MKENNEKKMKDEDEISKLIKAFPKDGCGMKNYEQPAVSPLVKDKTHKI